MVSHVSVKESRAHATAAMSIMVLASTGPQRDFDRSFRPTSNRVRQRWERLDLAQRRGAAIPPIDVYRLGDLHFVKDGHHRVSVAGATGQKTIEAYVTEVLTRAPATGISRRGGALLKAAGGGG